MYEQAEKISSWGKNVYVKIPITNSTGIPTYRIIEKLSSKKIKINITAVLSKNQINKVFETLDPNVDSILSIFAGRIADTGRDPQEFIKYAIEKRFHMKNVKYYGPQQEKYLIYMKL